MDKIEARQYKVKPKFEGFLSSFIIYSCIKMGSSRIWHGKIVAFTFIRILSLVKRIDAELVWNSTDVW